MKKFIVLFLSALFVLGLTSCKKDATAITPQLTELSVSKEGVETDVMVAANGDWEVSSTEEWIKPLKSDKNLHVIVMPNTDMALRQGDIILKSGKTVVMINVIQAYICTKIIPDQTELTFEKEGGTQTVGIDTDGGDIQIDSPDGFTATYANGNLSVTTEPVSGPGPKGKITLSCDDQTATISVKQKGDVCERCGGRGKIKCPNCNGTGISYMRENGSLEIYCTHCGGYGGQGSGIEEEYNYNIRIGSGRITCPDCGGSGR